MHHITDVFLANMTLIISFMYITLKLKEWLILKVKDVTKYLWYLPLIISVLSIWVMHHSLFFEGMRIDLIGVPIYFLSYLGGWKFGIIGILLPIAYRMNLGGPTVTHGILQGILVPFIIGALFTGC